MKILIDINHPAHVHYFRNFSKIMSENGHQITFVSRDKEMAHHLLKLYNINFINRGKGNDSKLGKFLYLIYADYKLLKISNRVKPDLFLNFLHPYPSHVARILGKPSLVFSDTEHAHLHHKLTVPFATKVYTPSCYTIDLGKKHERFNGYMELAYLHPAYFTPNPDITKILGVGEGEKYVIVRFVSWKATHDFDQAGMSLASKRHAVHEMAKYARVFITSEGELPSDLEKYRIKIPFDKIHDVLYYSVLLYGESVTMTSEASVLGTPSIFINNISCGYVDDQAVKYGLIFRFKNEEVEQERALKKAIDLINGNQSRQKYDFKENKIADDCIDLTKYMVNEVLKFNNITA